MTTDTVRIGPFIDQNGYVAERARMEERWYDAPREGDRDAPSCTSARLCTASLRLAVRATNALSSDLCGAGGNDFIDLPTTSLRTHVPL
jgi:hypothetical protein